MSVRDILQAAAGLGGSLPGSLNLYTTGQNIWGTIGDGSSANSAAPRQVGNLTTWTKVSTGGGGSGVYTFAIKNDNTLWGWGGNSQGALGLNNRVSVSSPVQIGSNDWAEISAQPDIGGAAAIKTNGTLWAWGLAPIGDDTAINRSSPVQIGALTDWSKIACGNRFKMAIKTNGTLWAWGTQSSGQLGIGSVIIVSSPVQVGALTDWSVVAPGLSHCVARKTGGSLWAWGSNFYGNLGQNNVVNASSPVQIGSATDWNKVAAGNLYSLAIKNNGTLWAWGFNSDGQLGLNDIVNRSSPVQVGALTNWADVVAGRFNVLAIKTDGTMWAWGNNYEVADTTIPSGVLGLGNIPTRVSSPVQVGSLTDWSAVATGCLLPSAVAIRTSGTLYTWGMGQDGASGTNVSLVKVNYNKIGSKEWDKASFGYNFSLGIKKIGTLWAWGAGPNGELGNNTSAASFSPVQIGSLSSWAQVSAGFSHCMAIRTNNTLWAWGFNGNGQLGLNDIVNRSSPVQVGAASDWAQVTTGRHFTVAVKTSGTLWSWGQGSTGRLGSNAITSRSSPVQVGALTNWRNVSAGGSVSAVDSGHCLADKTDNTLWAWGVNDSGQLGDNTRVNKSSPVQIGGLNEWYGVSAGTNSSYAVFRPTAPIIYSWGLGFTSALGAGTNTARSSPGFVGSGSYTSPVPGVSGYQNGGAFISNSILYSWGFGVRGGNPAFEAPDGYSSISTPTQVSSITNATSFPVQQGLGSSVGVFTA